MRSTRRKSQLHAGALLAASAVCFAARSVSAANFVTFTDAFATNVYSTFDTNSCAVGINNLITAGNYQFAAYYDNSARVMIARRALNSTSWQTYNTGFTIADETDDHNIIALAVDGNGQMHMSWDMHNVSLNYAISTANVLATSLPSITMTKMTTANAPSLFPTGNFTNQVTYPQFYNIPGSNNLVFTYRNAASLTGGGSGNGNQFMDVYTPPASTGIGSFTNTYMVNGGATSVNAYLNSAAFTSTGTLMTSWTYRASADWRTNSNIMFAQSAAANLTTQWQRLDGSSYTLPLIQSGAPANSVAQIIKTIPQGSALINQTSMTVDAHDHPMIATWYAPGWTPSSISAGTGNPNRQYMLVYNDGTTWRTSQISNRTSDTSAVMTDSSAAWVRDMGRPLVMVDNQNRVIVVTRSQNSGTHVLSTGNTASPPGTDNDLVIYYTLDLMNGGTVISTWQTLTLDTTQMGSYEPTYDSIRWDRDNILDLYFLPTGVTGVTATSGKVLEWNEVAFFAVPEPASIGLLAIGAFATLSRRRPASLR